MRGAPRYFPTLAEARAFAKIATATTGLPQSIKLGKQTCQVVFTSGRCWGLLYDVKEAIR